MNLPEWGPTVFQVEPVEREISGKPRKELIPNSPSCAVLFFLSGYECRSINLGLTEHSTLVLPKLLLRAVSISDVRAVDEIRHLLHAVQTAQT